MRLVLAITADDGFANLTSQEALMSINKRGGNIRALTDAQPFEGGQPVQILGYSPDDGLMYYILTSFGTIETLPSHRLQQVQIEGLFGGDIDWLKNHFPRFKEVREEDPESGKTTKRRFVCDWQLRDCSLWIQQEATGKGAFRMEDRVRGPGVYRPDADGSSGEDLIIHAGDQVFHGGDWRPTGHKYGNFIYTHSAAEPRPSDTAEATAQDGQDLLTLFGTWNYGGNFSAALSQESDVDLPAKFILGWAGVSMVVGALDQWRPHIYVTGEAAVGKTTLIRSLRGVIGGGDLCVSAQDPTSAGIRQQLKSHSRAMIVDECEQKAGSTRAEDILELARLSSSVDSGSVLRGSPQGKSQNWHLRSTFLFSGINPPSQSSAELGRVTMIELRPHNQIKTLQQGQLEEQIDHVIAKSPLFRARMINRFRDFEASLKVLRTALGEVGLDSRLQDQFGTLLAAYWTLTQDGVIPILAARDLGEGVQFADMDFEEVSTPRQCLRRLLMHPISLNAGRPGPTVGETIIDVLTMNDSIRVDLETLNHIGVRIEWLKGRQPMLELQKDNIKNGRDRLSPWVLIATNAEAGVLSKIFKETPWRDGAYATQLKRLPGALSIRKTRRFAGAQTRAVWLPAELFLDVEEDLQNFVKGYIANSHPEAGSDDQS